MKINIFLINYNIRWPNVQIVKRKKKILEKINMFLKRKDNIIIEIKKDIFKY